MKGGITSMKIPFTKPTKKLIVNSSGVKIDFDGPKVIFDDLKLKITIGQWLGLLPPQKEEKEGAVSIITHLDAEELMKATDIPKSKLDEIDKRFGYLLKLAGIDPKETCTLNQYNKDAFSFNCVLQNCQSNAKISLKWSSFMDSGPKLIIDYKGERRTYEYWTWIEPDKEIINLGLEHYTKINEANDNSYFRYLSKYGVSISLQNEDYHFSISFDRPRGKTDNKPYTLDKENKLQEFLLGLSFPFDICEVYKKICEICDITTDLLTTIPSFSLKVERKLNEKQEVVTDKIDFYYGQLKCFVLTRNGKTITIDRDGNWTYISQGLTINQSNNGSISYSISLPSIADLAKVPSPLEQYNTVQEEVEGIKKLTIKMQNREKGL